MKSVVRTTDQYIEEAKLHSCTQVLVRFKKEVERNSDYQCNKRDVYGFGDYFRKVHKNFRSIFAFKTLNVNGEQICCYLALRVFKRGDTEYTRFININTPSATREQITGLNVVNWTSIQEELENSLHFDGKKTILPELDEEELNYIQRDNGITQEIFDIPVYESKYWVESVRQESFIDYSKVADVIINQVNTLLEDFQVGCYEVPFGDNDDKVLCARLKSTDKDGWFLLGIGKNEVIQKIRDEFFPSKQTLPLFDEIASKCRRAYPFPMMEDDKDFWRIMEKDKDSNFILSDEEINIVSKPLTFPLFLSGRAGSGKSTMLQYLFAEFFLRYCRSEKVLPPVYLSYSSNLVDNAKKLSANLFSKNHAYLKQLKDLDKNFKDNIEPEFNNVFFVFQQLVRDCIGHKNPEILLSRFSSEKHVSYSRYRELWDEKFGKDPKAKKVFGPALSWHVIRTYIKGWDSEAYCEPQDYADIGRRNKSVTDEVFRLVYDKVWTNWYQEKQEEEQLWDDQDLVRYCIAPDDDFCETCVSERFSAIFCDESQDFTRIETEFILRLSLFAHRRIYNVNMLNQLPFVFAGDEFQTLNPTGFSWDSLRSYFTERLIHATELPAGVGAPEPITLTKNYRSTAPIVKLANRLQLLREVRCGGDSPSVPQIPYYAENEAAPVYCLSPANPLVWKKLCQMGVALIIPSAEGQSPKDFIEHSPIKGMIDFYDDGSSKNITIYNPYQAKGLEYPSVAVYGFDSTVPELHLNALEKWLGSTNPEQDTETKEIELKYFLSNAYVSATRAKTKLFILSDFSNDSFWAFAFSPNDGVLQEKIAKIEKLMFDKLNHPENWKSPNGDSLLGYIIGGDVEAITDENIVDAGEVAKITEERGMALRDTGLMRQAAARYREREKTDDVLRCEAYAYEFERNFFQAAESFVKAKKYDEAISDYWRSYPGKDLESILKAISKQAPYSSRFEVKVAQDALTGLSLNDFKFHLDNLLSILSRKEGDSQKDFAANSRDTWRDTLLLMLEQTPQASPAQANDVEVIIQHCSKLVIYGIDLSCKKLPKMAFDAELFTFAVELWDKMPIKDRPPEYHYAKCKILDYPENVVHWQLSGNPSWQNMIVDEYRADNGVHIVLDADTRKILENALFAVGNTNEQAKSFPYLLAVANSLGDAQNLLKTAIKKNMCLAKECYEALFASRWGNLEKWSEQNLTYQSDSLNQLVRILAKVKYVRSPKFMHFLSESFSNPKTRVVDVMMAEFGNFSRVIWNPLLFTEIGAIMEKRGIFIDAARYYEWVQRQTDDSELKKEMIARWIVCKERQAEKSDNAEEMLREAADKRREIKLSPDAVLPLSPKFERWEWLFSELQKISPEKVKAPSGKTKAEKKDDVSEKGKQTIPAIPPLPRLPIDGLSNPPFDDLSLSNKDFVSSMISDVLKSSKTAPVAQKVAEIVKSTLPSDNGSDATPSTTTTQNAPEKATENLPQFGDLPDKIFAYEICGYQFKYNPAKGELSISLSNEREDLRIKIKKGKFPENGDFLLVNKRLVKADDQNETPFLVESSESNVCVTDTSSYVSFHFPFGK